MKIGIMESPNHYIVTVVGQHLCVVAVGVLFNSIKIQEDVFLQRYSNEPCQLCKYGIVQSKFFSREKYILVYQK